MGLFDWTKKIEGEITVNKADKILREIRNMPYKQAETLNEFLTNISKDNIYCDEELFYTNIKNIIEKDIDFSSGYKLCKELYNTIVVENDNQNDIKRFNKFKGLILNKFNTIKEEYSNINKLIVDFKNMYNLFNDKEAVYNIYGQLIENNNSEKENHGYIQDIINHMIEIRQYFNDEGAFIANVLDAINKINTQAHNKEMRKQIINSHHIKARQLAGFYEIDEVALAKLPGKVKKITDDIQNRYDHLVQTFADKEAAIETEKFKAITEFKNVTSGILGEADETIAKINAVADTRTKQLDGLGQMIKRTITNFLDENPEAEEVLRAKDSGYNELLDENIPAKERYTKAIQLKDTNKLYHVRFDDCLKNTLNNEPTLLQGPSGCGKSTIARQVCDTLNIKLINIGFIADEFISIRGYMDANGNYVKSDFYDCYKYGYGCFIDEIDNSETKALLELNKITGTNGFIPYVFPNGEEVKPHPNFRLFAAANTFGEGGNSVYHRNPMDASTLDRYSILKLAYDESLEKSIMRGEEDIYEFLLAFRKEIDSRHYSKLLVTTKTMASIKKNLDSGIVTLEEAFAGKLIKGENPETLEGICDSIIEQTGQTRATKAFQKAIQKDRLLRK